MLCAPAPRLNWRRLLRWLFLSCVAALISMPAVVEVVSPVSAQEDNRALATLPRLPRSLDEIARWPKEMSAYLDDHFGLRRLLVHTNTFLHWHLLHESTTEKIVVGQNGRLFLAEGDIPYRDIWGNCGSSLWDEGWRQSQAMDLLAATQRAMRAIPNLMIILVPTAPSLYPQDLPAWIGKACSGSKPLASDFIDRIPDDLRGRFIYPLDATRKLPARFIEKDRFHWFGFAAQLFVRLIAENYLKIPRQISVPVTTQREESDLNGMIPGLGLSDQLQTPDFKTAGVESCAEKSCFNDPLFTGMPVAPKMLRYHRKENSGRLLILSDSFGAAAAGGFIEYYGDVIDISMYDFETLSSDDRKRLWRILMNRWRPDRIIMLAHDGNVSSLSHFMELIPDGP